MMWIIISASIYYIMRNALRVMMLKFSRGCGRGGGLFPVLCASESTTSTVV